MHDGPWIYVRERARRYGPFGRVVEFGGRVINGGVRELFDCQEYVSVDIRPGEGVDVVGDAADFETDQPFDVVVCCEVFEHCPRWPEIIYSAWRALGADGYLLLTCAIAPRDPHGSDGGQPEDGEFYSNPDPGLILGGVLDAGFSAVDLRVDGRHGDLFLTAVKGAGNL